MKQRIGKQTIGRREGTGPGNVSKLLGIHYSQSGLSLVHDTGIPSGDGLWIEDTGIIPDPAQIIAGPRIGVDYAGEDALLPYRFKIDLKSDFDRH